MLKLSYNFDTLDVHDFAIWLRCNIAREDAEILLIQEIQNGVNLDTTSLSDLVLSVEIGHSVQYFIIKVKELGTPNQEWHEPVFEFSESFGTF